MPATTLDDIRIASPCHESWGDMVGDGRVRFCAGCRQNVYNLSEMSRAEAQGFIDASEGRHCVRFYRRTDGTVLTKDCGCGRQEANRQMARLGTRFAMLFGLMAGAAAVPRLVPQGNGPALPAEVHTAPAPRPMAHMGDDAAPPPPVPQDAWMGERVAEEPVHPVMGSPPPRSKPDDELKMGKVARKLNPSDN